MGSAKIDEYTLKARAFPAFLALAPLGLIFVPTIGMRSLLLGLTAPIGGTLIVSFLLAQWGRDQGKLKEPLLFRKWGGKPTTDLLRHRNQAENRILRERRHRRLGTLAVGITLPSVKAEAEDPGKADEAYDAATRVLIQRTRDKQKFALLFDELVSYGFRRNLWGLKPLAILLLVGCICMQLCVAILFGYNSRVEIYFSVADFLLLFPWCFVVTPSWVYLPARAYADRLLDALDQMKELDPPSL